jgi:plasmid maintenance system antidote protein VapI
LARFYGTSPEFWMNLQAMHGWKAEKQSHEMCGPARPESTSWIRFNNHNEHIFVAGALSF